MKTGIRNGSLGQDWLGAIEVAARLGYDGVELDVGADYADSLMWRTGGCAEISAAAADNDCAVASLCLGALWRISPANRDEQVRSEARELIKASAGIAAELGAKWILLPVTPGGEEVGQEESVERWIDEMKQVAGAAEEAGISYCLENVGRGCGKSAADLTRLVRGIDSPAVGVYYDIGNAVAFENDPVAEIGALRDAIGIVHVKDHSNLLGQGDVPIPACLRALRALGYDDWLVLETSPTDDPGHAGAFNLGFLRGALAGL